MAKKLLWLGRDDKLDLVKFSSRAVSATFDGSAIPVAGALLLSALKHTATALNPGPVGAADTLDVLVTITGAAVGDAVSVAPPAALEADLGFCAFVSATDTVKLRLVNPTAAPIDPLPGDWKFVVTKL